MCVVAGGSLQGALGRGGFREQGWRTLVGSWVGIRDSGVISAGPQGRISGGSQRKRTSRGSPGKERGQ